jgi:hypothetical protein
MGTWMGFLMCQWRSWRRTGRLPHTRGRGSRVALLIRRHGHVLALAGGVCSILVAVSSPSDFWAGVATYHAVLCFLLWFAGSLGALAHRSGAATHQSTVPAVRG